MFCIRIDFDNPATTRTGNLAKSAVLAALEEEERERSARKPGEKLQKKEFKNAFNEMKKNG